MNRYKYVEVPLTDTQIELRKRVRDEEIQELRDRITELEEREIETTSTEMVRVVPGEEGYEDAPYEEGSLEGSLEVAFNKFAVNMYEDAKRSIFNKKKIPLA